jgi:hypothetical protein
VKRYLLPLALVAAVSAQTPAESTRFATGVHEFKTLPNDREINEVFVNFRKGKPDAEVWALTIKSSNANATFHRKIIFDKKQSKLLVMSRTAPAKAPDEAVHNWTCFHCGEDKVAAGVPWSNESVYSYQSKPGKAKETLPLSYKDAEHITWWP